MRVIGTFSLPRSSGPRVFSACALRGPEEDHTTGNKQHMIYVVLFIVYSFLLFFSSDFFFIKKHIKSVILSPKGLTSKSPFTRELPRSAYDIMLWPQAVMTHMSAIRMWVI